MFPAFLWREFVRMQADERLNASGRARATHLAHEHGALEARQHHADVRKRLAQERHHAVVLLPHSVVEPATAACDIGTGLRIANVSDAREGGTHGVFPNLSLSCTSARSSTSSFTSLRCPDEAATCSTVRLFESCEFTARSPAQPPAVRWRSASFSFFFPSFSPLLGPCVGFFPFFFLLGGGQTADDARALVGVAFRGGVHEQRDALLLAAVFQRVDLGRPTRCQAVSPRGIDMTAGSATQNVKISEA